MDNVNSPDQFNLLSPDQQSTLVEWIEINLIPIKTYNHNWDSYSLKHLFEKSKHGFYISNGAFKGAMKEAGYQPLNIQNTNWIFTISQKSPCF